MHLGRWIGIVINLLMCLFFFDAGDILEQNYDLLLEVYISDGLLVLIGREDQKIEVNINVKFMLDGPMLVYSEGDYPFSIMKFDALSDYEKFRLVKIFDEKPKKSSKQKNEKNKMKGKKDKQQGDQKVNNKDSDPGDDDAERQKSMLDMLAGKY